MGDSCAVDGYASSVYTIAMGAASSNGSQAPYDEDCAGKMAVTFVTNSLDEENLHIVRFIHFLQPVFYKSMELGYYIVVYIYLRNSQFPHSMHTW